MVAEPPETRTKRPVDPRPELVKAINRGRITRYWTDRCHQVVDFALWLRDRSEHRRLTYSGHLPLPRYTLPTQDDAMYLPRSPRFMPNRDLHFAYEVTLASPRPASYDHLPKIAGWKDFALEFHLFANVWIDSEKTKPRQVNLRAGQFH